MSELPALYRPENARQWAYTPDARAVFEAARAAAHTISPAAHDRMRIELVVIDAQKDFCFPEGSLFVAGRSGTGALDDNARIAELIYRNLAHITAITPTLDTHYPLQIFFASFWVDADGNPPPPHTVIGRDDVASGRWRPNPDLVGALDLPDYDWLLMQCLYYCEQLERAGKYQLYIWPEHCLVGGDGHALAGVIHEARLYHAFAREAQSVVEIKGGHPLTENYSVFNPEVLARWDGKGPLVEKRADFVERLLARDAVVFVGQAASHCVRSSVDDFLDEINARDPGLAAKCYIVTDCMSAVTVPDGKGGFAVDFTPFAEDAFARWQAAGMHLVRSDVAMEDWPGLEL